MEKNDFSKGSVVEAIIKLAVPMAWNPHSGT